MNSELLVVNTQVSFSLILCVSDPTYSYICTSTQGESKTFTPFKSRSLCKSH